MPIFAWLLLGAVQGLAEFLPVSSSGHLVLLRSVLSVPAPPLTLELLLHLGTMAAAVFAYQEDWRHLVWAAVGRGTAGDAGLLGRLLLAVAATGAVALPLEASVRHAFQEPRLVGLAFLATALLLALTTLAPRRARPLGVAAALAIGALQGVATFPGLSRSGTTIAAGLLLGVEADEVIRFSFLLAVPTVLVAVLRDVLSGGLQAIPLGPALLAVGLGAIRLMQHVVRRGGLLPFACYLLVVGVWATW
jgi:undecaprenyl-diphosphatase